MDVNGLHDCFVATLQADQNVRKQAELKLREAEQTPGFSGACLDILSTDGVNPAVKSACVIYFKNKVTKSWDPESRRALDKDEKPIIRERLIPAIIKSDKQLRNQFFPILTSIIAFDYPHSWPEFLPTTIGLFQNPQDTSSIYAGLVCFSELTRHYRWKTNEDRSQELDPIIRQYFPSLLQIGNALVEDVSSHSTYESGDMVKLILKIYKFVTYHDLPEPLREQEQVVAWGTFHVRVINMSLPQNVMEIDEDDRKLSPWVKSQKWGYANLFRLFSRYASKSIAQKYNYDGFKKLFITGFVPELLKVYFTRIEQWRHSQVWLSNECLSLLVEFIEHCVLQKALWSLVEPHVNYLISDFAFPILIPNEDVLDMFENDPHEYINMIMDVYEEASSPQMAVLGLLFTLVDKRKKTTLEPIMQFAYNKLVAFQSIPETLEIAKEKESVLRIMGAVVHELTVKKSPYYSQMESFFATFIFPNFKSQFPFLRARTCEVSCKFQSVELTNPENLSTLFQGVFECFKDDKHLPVELGAALALQAFIDVPQFKEAMSTIIVPTVERLLDLSNKIDNDAVSAVIQECVESFSEQLQPFGLGVMQRLSEQLLRLLREIKDAQSNDSDDYDDDSTKEMAALGVINTMITVLLSFENSAETVMKLEECYFPVIEFALTSDLEDYFAEIAELIENSTFLSRSVSPWMWRVFELLMISFKEGSALEFIDEMLAPLKNYLVYGASHLKTNQGYKDALFSVYQSLDPSDSELSLYGSNIVSVSSELAQNFILCLQEDSVPYLPLILTRTVQFLQSEDPAHASGLRYSIELSDVIIAALTQQPANSLSLLSEQQFLPQFFQLWGKIIPSLKRVYDLKLSTLGLLSIINLSSETLVALKLDSVLPQIGKLLGSLLARLPEAIQQLERKRASFNPESSDVIGGGHFDDYESDKEWEDEEGDPEGDEYLKFLESESKKLSQGGFYDDDDEEDFEDDPFSNTSLDPINVFQAFKEAFINSQQTDPNKHALICSQLTPQDQEVLTKASAI
ncbi:unnamed protein product [Kuraishia capsulata CBS 1993]|uniref:Importin N-terminal domain-containing protein n=1 Tax=Kuraishia capsulata CBS 1993 TaxID=1382522 RepID=W6MIL0_9ASCO|nr:uncharacterized protein KUCA_T00001723001 [Kuraishia capsulata CBS 1993]CDK25753.1 unnamed protein product [Kuraishia capsulata CBS 1993]